MLLNNKSDSTAVCLPRGLSRVVAVLVGALFFYVSASAQDAVVKISGKNLTIEQALKQIENQTPYNFGYNRSILDITKPVAATPLRGPLKEVLSQLLKGANVTWIVKGNYILISSDIPNLQYYCGKTHQRETVHQFFLYAVPGKASIDTGYLSNISTLTVIDQLLAGHESDYRIDITGTSPPDGSEPNERVILDRAMWLKSNILEKYPAIGENKVTSYSCGINLQGLKMCIEADPHFPDRDTVLNIVNAYTDAAIVTQKIKHLYAGVPFEYIQRNISPKLCGVIVCLIAIDDSDKNKGRSIR